jgi:outer membrane immunogenic protein
MRRQFLLASVGAIAIAGSAFAAEPLPPPPPVPIFSWTGLYVGVQVGYAWDQDPVTSTSVGGGIPATVVDGVVVTPGTLPFVAVISRSDSPSGVIGGAHLGYNLQINQWVAGLEGTVDGTSLESSVSGPLGFASALGVPHTPILGSFDTYSAIQGSIRLRAGIAFDRVLIYATGGAAFAGITTDYSAGVPIFLQESDSKTRSGWTVGGGLEYAVTNNWSIRAEYRYSDFGHQVDYPFAVLISPFDLLSVQHHLTQNQVQFGISYKFDTLAPVAPVVAKY